MPHFAQIFSFDSGKYHAFFVPLAYFDKLICAPGFSDFSFSTRSFRFRSLYALFLFLVHSKQYELRPSKCPTCLGNRFRDFNFLHFAQTFPQQHHLY